ncbi:cation-transporting P-type ATPase [Negadavirga shengliensis]|uniref:Cation-transporting P-type ATPase n=1 Tax=Negadavirga shengliensis TaxID=1389218 RepID=A0ABV9T052_9BACT
MIRPWHHISAEEALQHLESSLSGLKADAIQKRVMNYGKNVLPAKRRMTGLQKTKLPVNNQIQDIGTF